MFAPWAGLAFGFLFLSCGIWSWQFWFHDRVNHAAPSPSPSPPPPPPLLPLPSPSPSPGRGSGCSCHLLATHGTPALLLPYGCPTTALCTVLFSLTRFGLHELNITEGIEFGMYTLDFRWGVHEEIFWSSVQFLQFFVDFELHLFTFCSQRPCWTRWFPKA